MTPSERSFRSLSNSLSYKTLKGKTVLLVIFFTGVIAFLAATVLFLNTNIMEVSNHLVNVNNPLTIRLYKLQLALTKVSNAQRGYFITFDSKFKTEREEIWSGQIQPLLNEIKEIIGKYNMAEANAALSQLEPLVIELRSQQDELEREFREQKEEIIELRSDEQDLLGVMQAQQMEGQMSVMLMENIQEKIVPLVAKINTVVDPLIRRQSVLLEEDIGLMKSQLDNSYRSVWAISIVSILVAIIIGSSVVQTLRKSIEKPIKALEKLAMGDTAIQEEYTEDELNAVLTAAYTLKDNLQKASQFASDIGDAQFNTVFTPVSKDDTLGNALVHMRDRLKAIAEADKKRNWAIQGLAQFVEIIRASDKDLQETLDQVISVLVKYVQACQGTIFILDEEGNEKFLEMKSCFAFDRKKYVQKRLTVSAAFGEGLAGQAFLEKETIYMTEVPAGYMSISSGLGESDPASVLIVPLKVNDNIEGVIELASFNRFDQFEIEFVEKLAENIASTISSLRINQRTRKLLEESQIQAETLRAQEEEMRQNVEELAATQEEMKRKGVELEQLLQDSKRKEENLMLQQQQTQQAQQQTQSILDGYSAIIYLKDLNGRYLMVNQQFATAFGKKREEIIGKTVADLLPPEQAAKAAELDKEAIAATGTIVLKEEMQLPGKKIIFESTRFPLFDEKGQKYAYCGINVDITHKLEEQQLALAEKTRIEELFSKMMAVVFICKIDADWTMEYMSAGSLNLFGISPKEFLSGKITFNDVIHPEDREIVSTQVEKQLAEKGYYTIKYRVVDRAGNVKLVLDKGTTFLDSISGEPRLEGFMTELNDIRPI